MPLTRRDFLFSTGASLAAGLAPAAARGATPPAAEPGTGPAPPAEAGAADLRDWAAVRAQFDLAPDLVNLSTFYIASHPRPVREAIERHRRAIDANPLIAIEHAMFDAEAVHVPTAVKEEIAPYLGGGAAEIAFTGNTTTGLALVYHGLRLKPGQEILTTDHDHYSHHESIRLASEKSGAAWRKIPLFDDLRSVSEEGIVERVRRAVRPNTRAVGVTWVHSSTGLRLPIRRIATAIGEINAARGDADRALLIVDGVHGLGAVDEPVAATGCDLFAAGTHKWMFGPRGTGIVWAREATWAMLAPSVPSFESFETYDAWTRGVAPAGPTRAAWVSPGGFHAYEHQWAVGAAFRLHRQIGRPRIAERIRALNDQCKEGLARMPHVVLHTPRAASLSAGITCFDVRGMPPQRVVQRLLERRIVASTTPYGVSHARVAPGIVNSPGEVDLFLGEVRAMAGS
jgi:selenocysteine lyase/cysteine desulfurase